MKNEDERYRSQSPASRDQLEHHENINILESHANVSRMFTEFYSSKGYYSHPAGDLLASGDNTVIFTGATITPLKKQLSEGLPNTGFFMTQKCMRTKDLNRIYDLNVIPEWTNYFTMCGILASASRKQNVSEEADDLLTNTFGINKDNLLVQSCERDYDLASYWEGQGYKLDQRENSEKFTWKYGIPDTYGRGINFLFRRSDTGGYRELGNLISVESGDGIVKAYEFGFGVESYLSTLYGFKKPIQASTISSVIPHREGVQEKFVNAFTTSVVLFHHGIEPGRERERFILKKLVKGLSFLRRQVGISIDQIIEYSNEFESVEFESVTNAGEKLAAGVENYESQVLKFREYAQNQAHAHQLRNDIGPKLMSKLIRVGEEMGMLPPDKEFIVRSVLKNID